MNFTDKLKNTIEEEIKIGTWVEFNVKTMVGKYYEDIPEKEKWIIGRISGLTIYKRGKGGRPKIKSVRWDDNNLNKYSVKIMDMSGEVPHVRFRMSGEHLKVSMRKLFNIDMSKVKEELNENFVKKIK